MYLDKEPGVYIKISRSNVLFLSSGSLLFMFTNHHRNRGSNRQGAQEERRGSFLLLVSLMSPARPNSFPKPHLPARLREEGKGDGLNRDFQLPTTSGQSSCVAIEPKVRYRTPRTFLLPPSLFHLFNRLQSTNTNTAQHPTPFRLIAVIFHADLSVFFVLESSTLGHFPDEKLKNG